MKIIALFVLAASLYGQTGAYTGGLIPTGVFNATGATSTAPTKSGTSLPVACAVGQLFFKTDATPTSGVIYACPTTDTWVQQTGAASTNQAIRTIGATFGSFESGATALSGSKTACVKAYFAGTITAVDLYGDVSGSVTVGVLKTASGSWTGTASAASIAASAIPALSSAATYTDTTLTGWTTTVTAGNYYCFALSSPTTVAGVAISLKVASTN